MSQIQVPARSIGFTVYWAFAQEVLDLWAEKLREEEHQGCLSPVFYIDLDQVDGDIYVG